MIMRRDATSLISRWRADRQALPQLVNDWQNRCEIGRQMHFLAVRIGMRISRPNLNIVRGSNDQLDLSLVMVPFYLQAAARQRNYDWCRRMRLANAPEKGNSKFRYVKAGGSAAIAIPSWRLGANIIEP